MVEIARAGAGGEYLGAARIDQIRWTADIRKIRPSLPYVHACGVRAWELGRDDRQALHHATRALHLSQDRGQQMPQADALNAVGWLSAKLGQYPEARNHCAQALTLYRRYDNREGEADTLDSLGYIAHHSGQHTQAVEHYRRAIALRRDLDNTYGQANTLDRLAETYRVIGRQREAHTTWQQALRLYQAQHRSHEADRVQQHIDTLAEP
jgi:tetratricopeptide (TPR) repeat protein